MFMIFAVDLNELLPLLTGTTPAASVWALILLIVVALAAITKGGDLFTDSSVDIAEMTRIPHAIVGATIVSMATSFPEFMVSLTGTLSGSAEFAVGNAIGSCLCNIGLIVGVCAIVQRVQAKRRQQTPGIVAERSMLKGAGGFMLTSTALVWALSMFDADGAMIGDQPQRFGLGRWQAWILIALMVWYLAWSIRNARRARTEDLIQPPHDNPPPAPTPGNWMRTGVIFVVATATIVIGSRLLVCNGEALALRMGVPKLVLGLTLFALGTSLPELTISLIAVLKGHQALGIGNVIGSNVLNICWVMGTCAAIRPLPIAGQTVGIDLPATLLLTVLLIALPWKQGRITSRAGWVLLSIYLIHLVSVTVSGVSGVVTEL